MTREEAIRILRNFSLCGVYHQLIHVNDTDSEAISMAIKALEAPEPSAQPEPAIPLQWIEAQIEWLKSLDNAFSTLTALQISAMVNKWKGEQDG